MGSSARRNSSRHRFVRFVRFLGRTGLILLYRRVPDEQGLLAQVLEALLAGESPLRHRRQVQAVLQELAGPKLLEHEAALREIAWCAEPSAGALAVTLLEGLGLDPLAP